MMMMQATDLEPLVIWLSGLHVPESYLTALVQATCRKNGWPLDKSTLYTSVTTYTEPEDITERVHQGIHCALLCNCGRQRSRLEIKNIIIIEDIITIIIVIYLLLFLKYLGSKDPEG